MDDAGFIKLPRSLLSNPLWQELNSLNQKLFITILFKCAYYNRKFDNRGLLIDLQPGELCASMRQIASWCGKEFTKNHVNRGLDKLISLGFLTKKTPIKLGSKSDTNLIQNSIQLKGVLCVCNPESYGFIQDCVETKENQELIRSRYETDPKRKKERKKEERNNINTSEISQIPEFNRAHNVFVSDEDHKNLISKHKEELVSRSYLHLSKWKSQKSQKVQDEFTDIGRLEGWVITKVREDMIKEEELLQREARLHKFSTNVESSPKYLEMASNIEKNFKSPYYRLDIGTKGVEFVPMTGTVSPTFVNFGPQFVTEINHTLQKFQFRNIQQKQQNPQIRTETMIDAVKTTGAIHSFAL